jgi:outer membrane receptor protein involved in Fe transport
MDDPLVAGTFRSRERTIVNGSAALARIDLRAAGWLRVAVNQRRESFDSSGVIRDVPVGSAGSGSGGGRGGRQGGAPVTYDLRAFALDREVDVYSAGSEWQFHPKPKLGTALGATLNWQTRRGSPLEAEPTWIAGVSYQVTVKTRVHASVTHKIRFPSIAQLYSTDAGNPALRPERTYGLDAGVDRQVGGSSRLEAAVYVTQAMNFIERTQGLPFENHSRYRFAGGELVFDTRAIPKVDLRTSYMFLDAVDLTRDGEATSLQTRPRHRALLEATWNMTPSFSLRPAVSAVADQSYDSRGATPIRMRAPDYVLVDVGLTRRLTRQYELALQVNNVFDRLYEQAYGLPREGRTALLMLRARFD